MGGKATTQQLVRLMTKLSLVVREKESEFKRKKDCVTALSELKYQAEQGRHDLWHTTPKIIEALSAIIGDAEEASMIEGQVQSLSELNTAWSLSRSLITKKQLPLLAFILKYVRYVPVAIEKHSVRLDGVEYDRGLKIRQADLIVQNIEKILSRTEEVIYLHYLIRVFDTDEGKRALSLLIKKMNHKHPLGIQSELAALQNTLDIPSVMVASKDYVSIINRIYDTAEQSRGLHDKTVNEMMELRQWTSFTLLPLLERSYDILSEQSRLVTEMKDTWKNSYSEQELRDNINRLATLLEEENESTERTRSELGHYMRRNQVLKDILAFTKSSEHQIMSHHANLFSVAAISYNMFPLMSAFYSVDEFDEYWDAAEEFVLPSSSIRKMLSSIALRAFAGLL